ncbi:tumor necrosis factor receptor superfamily member 6-like isoform X2 [Bufo gargarizans]|uniref:tumor necrosis factor receptor superfamily member 6-like isoform X2 n=1 Tax=Bufo gargarizans TaxID=30331 RepID=UPI001CF2C28E|nr:tumor necrosis factor receptor superfamily member 6-like isoform X2 [Bufo gargarizans]
MKFGSEVLLLAILLSVVLADNYYHNTTDGHENQKASNSTLHKVWKREKPCLGDEYYTGTHCCKYCNAGKYAESDCTEEHGYPTCQDCTEGRDYMDEKNSLTMCHKCLQCDPQLGQREEQPCTVLHNTVCKCSEHFFCAENETAKSASCTKCQHCTPCDYGYAEICTDTKDAICKSERNHYALIAALVVVLILFFCCMCYECWTPILTVPEELEVEDIDLTELLPAFSDAMHYSTNVRLVREMGLLDPRIEAIQLEYHQVNEQKYQLLKAWYEQHGINGAFQKLIRTLEKIQKRLIAEKLIQIARSHRQQTQG